MLLRSLEEVGVQRWDEAALTLPGAGLFHHSAWAAVVRDGLGATPWFLAAEQDGEIVGLLPLAQLRRGLHTDLISLPLATVCGSVCSPAANAAAVDRFLHNNALDLATSLSARCVELRGFQADVQTPAAYATFHKTLDTSATDLKWIPTRQRAEVRKARQAGLTLITNQDVAGFGRWYDRATQRLGSPGLGQAPFKAIAAHLPEHHYAVHWVHHQGQPISAVLTYYWGNTVMPYYAAALPAARALRAAPFVYAEIACLAAQQLGRHTFDFGRSISGTGAFAFKKNFGFQPTYLDYQRTTPDGSPAPALMTQPPKWLSQAWRLTPHAIARLLIPGVRNLAV